MVGVERLQGVCVCRRWPTVECEVNCRALGPGQRLLTFQALGSCALSQRLALDCPPIPWVLGNLDLFTLHPTHASGRWGETVGSGSERPPEVWCAATLRAY